VTHAYHRAGHGPCVRFAAEITPDLLSYLRRLAADRALPAAEISRRVGERAEARGLHRPSYAAVRLHVMDARRSPEEPSWGELAVDVAWRRRHPDVFVDKAVGLLDAHLPEDHGLRKERR